MNRIRYYRERKGLTMEELGKIVGVTDGTISNYERGTRDPKPEMLLKLADALDTDVNALLGREQYPDPYEEEAELKEYLEELRTRPEMKMLFQVGKHMTVEQVKNLVAMIEGFAGRE